MLFDNYEDISRHTSPTVDADASSGSSNSDSVKRTSRNSRACDQCRRIKSKCERLPLGEACNSCLSAGIACTYSSPSHKRGPPKGYILTLERRLHQVEALLGAIVSSDDMRAFTVVQSLEEKDKLAAHIIHKVRTGPFGPKSKSMNVQGPGGGSGAFKSTKEDFLMKLITVGEEDTMDLVSPDRGWQDRLQAIIMSSGSQPTYQQQHQQQQRNLSVSPTATTLAGSLYPTMQQHSRSMNTVQFPVRTGKLDSPLNNPLSVSTMLSQSQLGSGLDLSPSSANQSWSNYANYFPDPSQLQIASY